MKPKLEEIDLDTFSLGGLKSMPINFFNDEKELDVGFMAGDEETLEIFRDEFSKLSKTNDEKVVDDLFDFIKDDCIGLDKKEIESIIDNELDAYTSNISGFVNLENIKKSLLSKVEDFIGE